MKDLEELVKWVVDNEEVYGDDMLCSSDELYQEISFLLDGQPYDY